MNEIKIFAPATVANVCCGFDILGFPLEGIGDEIYVKKNTSKEVSITRIEGGDDLPLDATKNICGVVAKKMIDDHNIAYGVEIQIKKGVKAGSGLGSSAASSTGIATAINQLFNLSLPLKKIVNYATLGEKVASGIAHADNVAPAIYGGFTLVRSDFPTLDIIKINTPSELYCSVIHPQIEVKTKNAREILKKGILLKDAIQQWGNVAGLIAGLEQNDYDLIGRSLHDIIIEPIRSILIPKFNSLKKTVLNTGALGCGISGSGPSIFALSKGHKKAKEVENEMQKIYNNVAIEFETHVSKINLKACQIIP